MADPNTRSPRVDVAGGRPLPYNLDAERSVLGAMLLSKEAVDIAVEQLRPEDFFKPTHGFIFDAINALFAVAEPVDVTTVSEALNRAGLLQQVGGIAALQDIEASTPAYTTAGHYAKIVSENSTLRRLISTGAHIAELGYTPGTDIATAVDRAEAMVFEVAQGRSANDPEPLSTLVAKFTDHLDELEQLGGAVVGISTGFRGLDDLLAGLHRSNLIIVGARPAMGKTAFALGMASSAAIESKRPVLIFSMEMSSLDLTQRLMAAHAKIDASKLRVGNVSEDDWKRIFTSEEALSEAPIYIDDTPGLSVLDIRTKARRLKSRLGDLGLIVIDYLQLMSSRKTFENRQVEVSDMSRGLKLLARELDVPVVALSQLSRNVEHRSQKDRRPTLADLRESGSIEQDADVVMFLYRESYYEETDENRGLAEVIVSKHRNGRTGSVQLVFHPQWIRFLEPANRADSPPPEDDY